MTRYFEPIALTDAHGQPMEWLKPYVPALKRKTRPPVVAISGGISRIIVRRETEDDLLRLDTT